jgi:hypothetical protein
VIYMGKIGKRWGKKVHYIRNWKKINDEGVQRGIYYLDFEWVSNWYSELEEMNKGKVGAPFKFPRSLIRLQAFWAQLYNFRAIEGITRQICAFAQIPEYDDYSTIWRRIDTFNEPLPKPVGNIFSTSTDGSGMKMNMSGEYFEEKYGDGKRKFIKVTITADPHHKDLLKVEVSIEGEGESEHEVAQKHMQELINEGNKIDKFFMDGAGDTHDLFDFCDKNKIRPVIKIRKNAVIDPEGKGSWRRRIEVQKYNKFGYKEWAKENEYGRRWTGTEGIFSAVKRIFGERVRSKQIENMLKEVKRRFWCYQILKRYAENKAVV